MLLISFDPFLRSKDVRITGTGPRIRWFQLYVHITGITETCHLIREDLLETEFIGSWDMQYSDSSVSKKVRDVRSKFSLLVQTDYYE